MAAFEVSKSRQTGDIRTVESFVLERVASTLSSLQIAQLDVPEDGRLQVEEGRYGRHIDFLEQITNGSLAAKIDLGWDPHSSSSAITELSAERTKIKHFSLAGPDWVIRTRYNMYNSNENNTLGYTGLLLLAGHIKRFQQRHS